MENESLLNGYYDSWHRGMFMAKKKKVFKWLHLRSHEVHSEKIPYDERYTPWVKRTGLLPFIQLVSRLTPHMNPCLITMLFDRWRPDPHTFHLPFVEIMVTLQDVFMILAVPIKGQPVLMSTDSKNWCEGMMELIGDAPTTEKMSARATYKWIQEHFKKCPVDADDVVAERYARAYLWSVVSRTLFSEGTGRNASYMWLTPFMLWDSKHNWGPAALAYLYCQLDDACCRTNKGASIGGAMVLLMIWSWCCIPVGCPIHMTEHPWDNVGDTRPTWAYLWDNTEEFHGESEECYLRYTNQIDLLTLEKVEWEPYGTRGHVGTVVWFDLNPKCLEEAHLWMMRVPLIVWSTPCHT